MKFIISKFLNLTDCEGMEHATTYPELPVNHGTEVEFTCHPGYVTRAAGDNTVACNNGVLLAVDGATVSCEQIGKFKQ